jgi:Methyltransferase domain
MRNVLRTLFILSMVAAATGLAAQGTATATQQTQGGRGFQPSVGQPGKDVVWVPTPQALVDKMLEMAKVTPKDYLMDLGSGDGRTVITAAKRGLHAQGIEYNPDMVALSKKNAEAAGVSALATFTQADLFTTDFSKADVITMFLLPTINMKLRPTILAMKPGTRVVSNSFTMEDWEADRTETVPAPECTGYCTALLWIVPAKVEGTWQMTGGPLTLTQKFQMVSGTLGSAAISNGRLTGAQIAFTAGGKKYTGTVSGNTITGDGWSAARK